MPWIGNVRVVLRSAWLWFLLAVVTVLVSTAYLLVGLVAPEGRAARGLDRFWVWAILRASHVKLSARGLENVERGRSYVVMANHRSLYDVPVLHYLLGRDRDLRWIGKRELLRIPFFGWAFAASRHVAIDRQHRERAVSALERAAAESDEGVSFAIMPEGTRNPGSGLLPFKRGGFHLAIDTGLPILPVGIVGAERLLRKGSWRILPGSIEVVVRPALPVEGLEKEDLDELIGRTRSEILAALGEDEPATAERTPR